MKRFVSFVLLFASTWVLAQDDGDGTSNGDQFNASNVPPIDQLVPIPSSPEAQAFTKYGGIKNSMNSGTPQISIPIANIDGRAISIPITLGYDPSGLEVEKISTWVGLNWNLSVGGVVSRKVHGLPDDNLGAMPSYTKFYDSEMFTRVRDENFTPISRHEPGDLAEFFTYQKSHQDGKQETQPDAYSFNVNGLSGTMYIDYNTGEAYCMEHPDIKIVPTISSNPSNRVISGWTIFDKMGNEYQFQMAEVTHAYDGDALERSRIYNSSWFLTKIITANNRDEVRFQYSNPELWQQPQLAGRGDSRRSKHTTDACGNKTVVLGGGSPEYQIRQFDLQTIEVNGAIRARFIAGDYRKDLRGKRLLNHINLYDLDGNILNTFDFEHSYFGVVDDNNDRKSRLKLDALYEHGRDFQQKPKKYQFVYHSGTVPSRDSFAMDYWGFYNGQNGNRTLIPYNNDYDKNDLLFNGANREPSLLHTKIGMLEKIVYPTGGFTELHYKLHNDGLKIYYEEVPFSVGGASISGGVDNSNPYNYCQDDVSQYPIGNTEKFEITEAGDYEFNFNVGSATGIAGNFVQYVAVYPTGSGECISTPLGELCGIDEVKDFCEVYLSPSNVFEYSHSTTQAASITEKVHLKPGHYRILILNNNPSVVANLEVIGYENQRFEELSLVGGLRTYKMIDWEDEDTPAQTKYYYYNDITNVDFQSINQTLLESDYPTSGKNQVPLDFEQLYVTEHVGPGNDGQDTNYSCQYLSRYSSNRSLRINPHIVYPKVTEVIYSDENQSLFTVSEFHDYNEGVSGIPFQNREPLKGKLLKKRVYETTDNDLKLLREELYEYESKLLGSTVGFFFQSDRQAERYVVIYEDNGQEYYDYKLAYYNLTYETIQHCWETGDNDVLCIAGPTGMPYKRSYSMTRWFTKLLKTTIVNYDGIEPLIDETSFVYDESSHFQQIKTQKINSDGKQYQIQISYPHDVNTAVHQQMVNDHRIGEPVKTEVSRILSSGESESISSQYVEYENLGQGIFPYEMEYSVRGNDLEPRIRFLEYDVYGNPLEVSNIIGTHSSYLWGYNYTLPIAKIENSTYDQVLSALGVSVESLQSMEDDQLSEALNVLRDALPDAMVTTYTYQPQAGIKSVTDPAGQTTNYEYDWLNRLESIKDHNGHILEAYQYGYSHE